MTTPKDQLPLPGPFSRRPFANHLTTLAAVAVLALAQAACGGGGGDSTPTDNPGGGGGGQTTPLSAPTATPAAAATGVARTAVPTLAFGTAISPTSVTASSVTLSLGTTPTAITPSVTGSTVTLTPALRLAPLATYTIGASTAVTGTGGQTLASAFTSSFTTTDASWDAAFGTPDTSTTGESSAPVFAFDAQGNAVAVWIHDNSVMTSRMDAATGAWSAAQTLYSTEPFALSTDPTPAPSYPTIAVGPDGNAVAVWTGHVGAGTTYEPRLFGATLTAGNWTESSRIDTATDYVTNIAQKSAVIDGNGHATVIFNAMDPRGGNPFGVYTADLAAGAWTIAKLDSGDGGFTGYGVTTPQIALSSSGAATAAWVQGLDGVVALASRASATAAWSDPVVLTTPGTAAEGISLASDSSGRSALAWQTLVADAWQVYTSYVPAAGGTPGTAEPISTAVSRAPSVSLHPSNGDLLVTWAETHAGGDDTVARRRLAAGTWEAAQQVSVGTGVIETRVAYDPGGNALATYNQSLGPATYTMSAARWVSGTGWGNPTQLAGATDGVYGGAPALRFDASGSALQLWKSGTVIRSIRFQ